VVVVVEPPPPVGGATHALTPNMVTATIVATRTVARRAPC
jgi:hypothetical protein